jgi:hypothetical protein
MDERPPPSESSGSHVVSQAIGKVVLRRSIALIVGSVVALLAALFATAILLFGPAFFRWWG